MTPSSSLIPSNHLKQLLRRGASAVGFMLTELRQPSVLQVMANAGFDFVLIDNEHGPYTIETIADLSRVARMVGITPIVRVPEITYAHVTQSLDAGAQGIMIPRIAEPEQVRTAVQYMKYPPVGARGVVVGRGHTTFATGSPAEMMARSNEETLLVVQIEMQQAVDRLDDILSVEGADVALVGPTDLSIALGVPGAMDDPKLVAAIEKTVAACTRHKVTPAIHMNDLLQGTRWAAKGMKMISLSSELGFMMKAGHEATVALRAVFEKNT